MNATSLAELRNGAAGRDATDDARMDQIRELLFGDFKRENDARMALLEARVREIEQALHRRVDLLQTRLDALVGETGAQRRQAHEELSRGLVELSDRIRRLNQDALGGS